MTAPLPERVPQNAPGDFYVEAGRCTCCCLVHGEAPGLLNDPAQPFDECYFRRQPQTPDEVEQAIRAICISEMCALRCGGTDESIITTLRSRQSAAQCNHAPEGVAARGGPAPAPAAQRPSLWRRLFGGDGRRAR